MTQTMQLLRTDQKGRVRTPRERREALLEEYDRSGASAAAFAKMCGVKYQTFVGWVQQRKRAGMAGPVNAVRPDQASRRLAVRGQLGPCGLYH